MKKVIVLIFIIIVIAVGYYIYAFVRQEWPKALIIRELHDKAASTLKTEVEEFNKPDVGMITIKTTYRGENKIIAVMTYSNVTTRTFFLNGSPICSESDDDGDGVFESFLISSESISDFDQFKRTPDGNIEPISEEEYLELKQILKNSDEYLIRTLKNAESESK